VEKEEGYGGFAKFMMLMVPVVMVVILLVILAAFIDVDFRNRVFQIGNSIPIVKNIVPEPKVKGNSMDDDQIRSIKMTEKIEELQKKIAELEGELLTANESKGEQEQSLKNLQSENAQLKTLSEENLLESEQYEAKIQELASMFSKMTPSKAAPIIQNMTVEETVLLFSAMRPDDRVRIMEKMNPKRAADATMMLKDNVLAKDIQISALQSRLQLNEEQQPGAAAKGLASDELAATFNVMEAKSAAELLLKMNEISPSKVLSLLESLNDNARSGILTEMSKRNQATTAQIVSKILVEKK